MTSAPEEHGRDEAATRSEGTSAPPGAEEGASEQAVADDLDRLLAEARRERDEYLGLAQRAKADFENYRKRAARESAEAERRGKAALARELLPAIDNLERALRAAGIDLGAAPESDRAGAGDDDSLGRGVAMVLGDLQGTLARAGVEPYDPLGERFDPAWHEALQTRAVEGTAAGVVVETLERGYRLDGQVLRAARVVVSE